MIISSSRRSRAFFVAAFLSVGLLLPWFSHGQEELRHCDSAEVIDQLAGRVQLNVPLPGVTTTIRCQSSTGGVSTYNVLEAKPGEELSTYLRGFYVYFVWVVGILAAVMVMYAGIRWITAAGNSSQIENAKTTMNGAIIGLVLTLTSYLILQAINPELVRLRVPNVTPVTPKFVGGFCTTINGEDYQALADKAQVPCGQVFQYKNEQTGQSVVCMSQGCISGYSCINCRGDERPFQSCTGSGLQCGFYDNQVIVTGTVGQVSTEPVYWVKFIRKNIKSLDNTQERTWKEVATIKGSENFELGDRFVFDTEERVPLNQFKFHVCFGNKWGCRECGSVDPSGNEDIYIFDIPYTPGGRPSERSFIFDFEDIYQQCIS